MVRQHFEEAWQVDVQYMLLKLHQILVYYERALPQLHVQSAYSLISYK